ncbi:MAG TPA: EamA family transporter [Acidimicrobiia bacterium]
MSGESPAQSPPTRLLTTSHGINRSSFTGLDWTLFGALSLMWGSSFFFIAVGLESFRPGVVTLSRIGLGALTLVLIDRSGTKIERTDWPRVVLLSFLWTAIPYTLFPIAQQWISSGVAGMLNATTPLLTALVTFLLIRHAPGRIQLLGLVVGFAGVALISRSEGSQGTTQAIGVLLVISATACYALAINMIVPMQQKYGSEPVMKRVLALATLWVLPYGLASFPASTFSWQSLLAMLALGIVGTGLALNWAARLVGRVGGTRASTVTYVIPVVALLLGMLFLDEQVYPLALLGTALVIAGAYFTSRREA